MNALHVKQLSCASWLLFAACKGQVEAGSRGGAGQALRLPLLSLTTLFTLPLPVHAPHSALVPTRHALPRPLSPCRAQRSMPRQPVSRRVAAVKAYYWAHGSLPLAAIFLGLLTGGAYHGNPHTFIPYWVNNFELRGNVHDKPPPGRPPHMDLDQAWECCYLIQAGYKLQTGEQRYFRSIRHAVSQCPRLKEILGSKHMSQQGALRSIKKICPELARRTLRFVRLLAPATKQARAAYAAHMLSMVTVTPDGVDATQLQRYLARFMWIDSKTVYVVPKDHLVYAPLNADMYIEDARLPRSRSQINKKNYYVVVNAVLGPVYFKVVTGTTGIREVDPTYPAEGYLVSGSECSTLICI